MVVAQVLSFQELVQVCLHEVLDDVSAQFLVKEPSVLFFVFFLTWSAEKAGLRIIAVLQEVSKAIKRQLNSRIIIF